MWSTYGRPLGRVPLERLSEGGRGGSRNNALHQKFARVPAATAGMAPKKRKSSSATAAAKRKKAPAADWRQPVFYWRGTISGSKWEGTWVASEAGLPSDADFAASTNAFKLVCSTPVFESVGSLQSPGLGGNGGSGTFTGSYKLDNGEGPADYSDLEHEISVNNGPPSHHPALHSWAVVGACGDTEFGRFVSLGVLDGEVSGGVPGDDTYSRLTLVRRYIAEDDPRNGMSAKEVACRVTSCGKEEWAMNAPWLALPWKVPSSWPAPLSASPAFRDLLEAHCEDEGTDWCVGFGPLLQHT